MPWEKFGDQSYHSTSIVSTNHGGVDIFKKINSRLCNSFARQIGGRDFGKKNGMIYGKFGQLEC